MKNINNTQPPCSEGRRLFRQGNMIPENIFNLISDLERFVETFSVKSRPKPYVLNVQENHVSSEEQMVSDIWTIFIILYV